NENSAFSGLEPVRLGNIHDLYMRYLHSNRLTLLVGIFLGVLGLVLLFCCLFLWIFYRSERRILYSSLITFLLGFYILAFNELPQFLNDTLVFDNFLEFLSLFYLPPAFIAFLGSVREKEKRRPYIYMALLDLVIATVIVLLHVFHIVHINNCVTLIHLLILAEGLLLIAMHLTQWVHDRRTRTAGEPWRVSERMLMAGFFIMMVMAMIDIARYSFMRYFGAGGDAYANLNYTTAGAFLFAVCLILNFFYYHIERLYAEDMLQRLSGLAFTDPLTGMANRSRCEQMLERFDKEDFACTVISIDVDRLKIINDRHGHAAGDRYLADTAEILTRCFQDAELLGRMGGDEFIAVMSGTSMVKTDHSIDMLQELLAEKNTGPELFPYAMSYGVASTDEEHIRNVRDALREADLRMYSMKQAHHAAKEGT
ncbi:MAG: GGDEF domain-containing protein, partial [Lachnospiraceae bacterium]|nr:GGDEF domain-containing protein [Lachnospiraceae bacterium]